jgi:hypothetical protein
MKLKMTVVSAICLFCSMVLFPLFALGGIVALLILAAGAETLRLLRGDGSRHVDLSAARAAAMRICYSRLHHS